MQSLNDDSVVMGLVFFNLKSDWWVRDKFLTGHGIRCSDGPGMVVLLQLVVGDPEGEHG